MNFTAMPLCHRATLVFTLLLLVTATAQAQSIVYVDEDAGGAGDGSSWADAYTQFQNGLADAAAGEEVWVAYGTYFPDEGTNQTVDDRTATFALPDEVGVYGGFVGDESSRDQRSFEADTTRLSGDIGFEGFPGDNAYHVVSVGDTTATLDGVLVTGGNANGSGDQTGGGGLRLELDGDSDSNVMITNVTVRGNVALEEGGGLWYFGRDSDFRGRDSLAVTGSTFEQNTTTGGSGTSGGGGMYTVPGSGFISLMESVFKSNVSENEGGGLDISSSSALLVNVTFSDNTADGEGGGIAIGGGTHNLRNVTFDGNSSSRGGGFYQLSGEATVSNSSFIENSADRRGGAVDGFDCAVLI